MKEYLVSIVIPVFNRAHTIRRGVESCLRQSYKNLEIIVVDDASSDNLSQILGSINDKRIKFIQHDRNKGPAASRNTGIRNANGDFIAFLDSDDEWRLQKIERQIETFATEKENIGLAFTNGYNEEKERSFIASQMPSGVYYHPQKDKFYPLRKLIAPPSSWMLPVKVIKQIGYFDETMYNWDDGDYLARVAYQYPIYFLNEDLVIWHACQEHVNIITPTLIKGKEIFLRKNLEFLKKDRRYLFKFYRTIGKDLLKLDKRKARGYLFMALRLYPLDFSTVGKILRTF